MHLSQLYTSSHLTSKNLPGYLQLYTAVVSNAIVELDRERNVYVCEAIVPCVPKVSTSASTETEALARMLMEVQSVLSSYDSTEWPEAWRSLAAAKEALPVEPAKTRQSTVGVTSPTFLIETLRYAGRVGEANYSETARRLATAGFEEFDSRIMEESPKKVLAEFSEALNGWRIGSTQQWMLRLDPNVCTRLKLSAKEFGKSTSEFAQMCIANALLKPTEQVAAANDIGVFDRRVENREHA
jgi:hypothetical protein